MSEMVSRVGRPDSNYAICSLKGGRNPTENEPSTPWDRAKVDVVGHGMSKEGRTPTRMDNSEPFLS